MNTGEELSKWQVETANMAKEGSGTSTDIEALRKTVEESRLVLDHQIALLNDIDDKAAQMVRLSILLIALIISVGQVMGPEQLSNLHSMTKMAAGVALFLLFLVVLFGIGIYDASDLSFGVSENHRSELKKANYTEREWLNLLLDEYNDWTDEADGIIENNAKWLSRIQVGFVIAIIYLFATSVPILTPLSAPIAFGLMTLISVVGLIITGAIVWYRDD